MTLVITYVDGSKNTLGGVKTAEYNDANKLWTITLDATTIGDILAE